MHGCRRDLPLGWLVVLSVVGLMVSGCERCATSQEWIAEEARKSLQSIEHAPVTKIEKNEAMPPPEPISGEVRLTLLDALKRALANNHDIQIAGYQPPQAELDVTTAQAVFDPSVFLSNTYNRTNRPTQSVLDTGSTVAGALIQNAWSYQGGLKSKIPTGATAAIYEASDYLKSNSQFVVPNPQYATRFNVEFSQPLLKGFGIDYNMAPIRVACLNSAVSFQDFRKNVMDVVATVANAYWQVAFDIESVRVTRVSMELAAEVLRRETVRRARGVTAEVDLNRAQAAVALRRAELIRAENQVRESADKLKLLMNSPDLPLTGTATIVPIETPAFYLVSVNRTAAIAIALARRPDLARGQAAVAVNQIRVDVAKEDRLPKLDSSLKFIMNGLNEDMGSAIDSQSRNDRISWSAGLEFELPLGNRAADSTYRKRRLEYEQSLVELDALRAKAVQEINSAVRSVDLAHDEVEATLAAKTAAELVVRGERTRFELGQTTNDELLRAQETLANSDRDHIRAVLNFNLSLVSLARAQGTLLEDQGVIIFQPESAPSNPRPLGLRMAAPKKPLTQ